MSEPKRYFQLIHEGEEAIFINYGERIAQLLIQRVELPKL